MGTFGRKQEDSVKPAKPAPLKIGETVSLGNNVFFRIDKILASEVMKNHWHAEGTALITRPEGVLEHRVKDHTDTAGQVQSFTIRFFSEKKESLLLLNRHSPPIQIGEHMIYPYITGLDISVG